MLTIADGGSLARALKTPIDGRLKQLLVKRRDQLGGDITDLARFIVVQSGDSLEALEHTLGFNILLDADGLIFPNPGFGGGRWEWIADHGHCWEAPFIFDDSGFAHVVLMENVARKIHPDLLQLCTAYATDPV